MGCDVAAVVEGDGILIVGLLYCYRTGTFGSGALLVQVQDIQFYIPLRT